MNEYKQVIEIFKMENELMEFNPSTGEEEPIELQNEDNQDLYKANLVAIEVLETQINNGWIPVSEKLPEDRFNENGEPVEYNVMLRRATEPTTLSIDEHGKWFDWRGHYYNIASLMAYELDVIAWQPLPEPWREEKHD